MIRIRAAHAIEAERLARLHVAVWRDTYGHIAPPEAYRLLDETRRLPYWRATLASGEPTTGAMLAERSGDILGLVSFGSPSQPALSGAVEIKHLYVLAQARGAGLGARLLLGALDHFRGLGLPDACLAVVAANTRARTFYAAMGGTETGAFIDAGPLWRSENVIVRWQLGAPRTGQA
ncbi:GNAT family N-acetyltransferase [Roseicyclus mahoneyensis]|uniref:Acetyltransferase (GNAT) family protein n=1 Tax=Roseicyclus mahoneyensis TaxID=164332 RepID=A0A316GTI1_9RHOB|nr:GNAT family N-acetyltransferase [Roseicyclus mahoneyensis]PWK62896.1 acetyltransferase (GNAT) family protein [Roseicyclus mahoneyensis]